jgi:hypothetical protein
MARELITKNEIINENWMYTASANADGRVSCLERALSLLSRQRRLSRRKNTALDFVIRMDNSMCHSARKLRKNVEQQDSTSLGPRIFTRSQSRWFLVVRTFKRTTQGTCAIDDGTNYWGDYRYPGLRHFYERQSVFAEWNQRLAWVITERGEYCIKWLKQFICYVRSPAKIQGGRDFLDPL